MQEVDAEKDVFGNLWDVKRAQCFKVKYMQINSGFWKMCKHCRRLNQNSRIVLLS